MPTVNLATKYSDLLDQRFSQKSLTEAWCGHDYDWDGTNTIKVWTIGQATINDYNAAATGNRFGTPTELGDEVNSYQLRKNRSFTHTLDITNTQDQQNIKKANAVLKQIWDEQMVPEIDQYRLRTWASGAGLVEINSTALSKSNIIEALLSAHAAMNNRLAPREGRVCFVTETTAVKCKLATELQYNEGYTSKAIVNGMVAKLNNCPIVAVPDQYMPSGVEFLIKYKRATADPTKLKMLRVHTTPQGYAGALLEGLTRYDSFVLAQKANGVYVYAKSGVVEAPAGSVSTNKVTLTSTTGSAVIKYTTDGTNPKTSDTAKVYSAPVDITANTLFRAYASKAGMVDSGITEYQAVHT